jgi:tRNA-dihydrouridine synthase B
MAYLTKGVRPSDPTLAEQYASICEHLEDILDTYGADGGVRIARKHIGWYTSGLHGSAEFRHAFNMIGDAQQAKEALHVFYARQLEGQYTNVQQAA